MSTQKKAKTTHSSQSSITKYTKSPTSNSSSSTSAKRKLNVGEDSRKDSANVGSNPSQDPASAVTVATCPSELDWNNMDPLYWSKQNANVVDDISKVPDPDYWYYPSGAIYSSPVWKYIQCSSSISWLAECKCGKRFKRFLKNKANTSNMIRHLKNSHHFNCSK